jgi:hypothetical protein
LDPFEGAGGFAGDFDVFAFEGLVGAEFPGFDFDGVEGAVGFFGFVAHEEGAVGVFLFDRAFDVVAPFAGGGLAEAEEAAMVFADDAVVFEFLDFGHAVALAFDGLADGESSTDTFYYAVEDNPSVSSAGEQVKAEPYRECVLCRGRVIN